MSQSPASFPPATGPRNFMAAVTRIGGLLQTPGLLEVKLKETSVALQEALGCELVWLGLLEDKGRAVVCQSGLFPSHNPLLLTHRLLQPGDLEDVVTGHQKLLQIPDIQRDIRCRAWWKAAQEWGICGTVAFPIVHRGEVLGLGVLGQCRWGLMVSAEEEEGLYLVGGLLGGAIAGDEGLARRQEELTSPLLTLAARLRQASDTETILQTVVDELHERLKPTRTVIYWLTNSREFEVRAFTQESSIYYVLPLGMRVAVRDLHGLYQQLCQDRLVSIADTAHDQRGYLSKALVQRLHLQALLAHPIIFQNKLLGYLALEQCDGPRIWTDQEQRLIQGMANLVGVTATQAKLYEMERRRFLEQMLINRIIQDIRNSLDPNEVMGSAVDRLGQGLNVDRCVLLNYDPHGPGLKVLHQFCKPGIPAIADLLPWPQGKADMSMLTAPTPVPIEDTDKDFRFLVWREALRQGSTRSLMICGLAHQGQPNGILCLHRCFVPQPWTYEEREIFQAVADQVGIALGQATLFQQAREQVELETKLNLSARRIRSAGSGEQVLQLLLQELAQMLEAPQVLLAQFGGERWEVLDHHQTHGTTALYNCIDLAPHTPLLEHLLKTEEALALIGPLEGIGAHTYSSLGGRMSSPSTTQLQGVVLVLDRAERKWRHVEKQLLQRLIQEALLTYAQTTAFLKLQQLSRQLKELNQYRNTMVSIASHEMRTPLTSIALFVETLQLDRELVSDQDLEQMQAECTRMTDLLNNLTTLVNLEANTTSFNYCTMVPAQLLEHLHHRIAPLAQEYQAQITLDDQTGGTSITMDEPRLEAVLYSLLENACKHTQAGVHVGLQARIQDQEIWFMVSDNGQGIPAEKLPTLFQPFIRVEDVMNHSKGGAGLGLAIARETVEKLGGTLSVTSTVGRGSSFTVQLPLQPS
ncbi:GAF domain-containing protein [Anthocerotibacter panamensis]|uniref:GAF domain-containing protein n=1 Tax=Anthocerotibacter panamensis TaxID=2857077 RepID=UPI001C408716|nr:GAF domain-containing protein [Anthocerotibacter panamensis]